MADAEIYFMPRSRKAVLLAQADDKFTAKYVDKYLGFTTHKTHTPSWLIGLKPTEEKIISLQENLYKRSLDENSLFRYEMCNRFQNELKYGAKIVAQCLIKGNTVIRDLCGQCFTLEPEDIRKGVNDFSMLESCMTGDERIFLGPAAYVNHDCEPNSDWYSITKSQVCLKTRHNIFPGQEITAFYGSHYFGMNNELCQCETCETLKNEQAAFQCQHP